MQKGQTKILSFPIFLSELFELFFFFFDFLQNKFFKSSQYNSGLNFLNQYLVKQVDKMLNTFHKLTKGFGTIVEFRIIIETNCDAIRQLLNKLPFYGRMTVFLFRSLLIIFFFSCVISCCCVYSFVCLCFNMYDSIFSFLE